MKPAGFLFFVPVGLGLLSAAEPDPPKLSARLSAELRASLPQYAAPAAPATGTDSTAAADPDTFVLPKIVIQEKRLPGNDPDVWLRNKVIQRKAMGAYRDSMTDLEWVLNCWFIPIYSAPPSVRARMAYEGGKIATEIDRLNNVIKAIEVTDPKMAARLRRGMDPEKLPEDD